MTDTPNIQAAIKVVGAIAEAIRGLKEVPSGHLYARLMENLTLEQYNSILDILVKTDLISIDGSHLIRWTGPEN